MDQLPDLQLFPVLRYVVNWLMKFPPQFYDGHIDHWAIQNDILSFLLSVNLFQMSHSTRAYSPSRLLKAQNKKRKGQKKIKRPKLVKKNQNNHNSPKLTKSNKK